MVGVSRFVPPLSIRGGLLARRGLGPARDPLYGGIIIYHDLGLLLPLRGFVNPPGVLPGVFFFDVLCSVPVKLLDFWRKDFPGRPSLQRYLLLLLRTADFRSGIGDSFEIVVSKEYEAIGWTGDVLGGGSV